MTILSSILMGLLLFLSTNIDEFFLGFLLSVQDGIKKKDIWIGKFLALAFLFGISFGLGYMLHILTIPIELIGLLGAIPLYIGMKSLINKDILMDEKQSDTNEKSTSQSNKWIIVASIHIASGGDNIGVYTPVFSTSPLLEMVIFCCVFIIMTCIWAASPNLLVQKPELLKKLEKIGKIIFPWLMFLLGIVIFWNTGLVSFIYTLLSI